ncbi:MAG: BamA/TamA family outer membrane protein [Methylococcales bacterium]|nr:BamA/TamA family outer membrane protein [Methylococcales bacterium]
MKKSHYIGKLVHVVAALLTPNVWAVGIAQSTDRPSLQQPSRPDFLSEKQGFTLPKIPDTNTLTPQRENIYIAQYQFQGNTVFDESQLQTLTLPYKARTVRIDELEDLRQQITHFYIDHGYINSGARILSNALKEGILTFDIVEGKLDDVQIHGQERLNENYIKNRLLNDEPLNINDVKEKFQLLLTDPLISSMQGSLLPSAQSNRSILSIDVIRARPYQVTFFGNNYRPPSVGGEGGGVSSWVSNLTGLGDTLNFTFQASEGTRLYSGGWSMPIFNQGTQVYFNFTEGDSWVMESPADNTDITSKVHNIEGGISHPLIENLQRKLIIGSSFAVRQNDTRLLGNSFSFNEGVNSGHTQATVVRFFQEHIERREAQVLALRSTFSVGLNALGSTPQTNINFPSSEFFAWLGQGQYAHQVLDNGSQIVLRGHVQVSNSSLLPIEQIAVGGVNTVRGYRENELVRDEGFSNSVEFHYPLFGEPNAKQVLSLVPFVDYGGAWNRNQSARYLLSTGLGLNWKFDQFNAEFYWAHKLNAPEINQHHDLQDEGIHFQLKLDAF